MRSVEASTPSSYWAGPHELRAFAQYLRLPVVVIDVDAQGVGNAQIYSYADYEVGQLDADEPLLHESGCYRALSDTDTGEYFRSFTCCPWSYS
ncbi:hypothetical protein PI125_g21435 [Phytophthora idaei]|nr:hypothetical protein PI125_g21435 [Phytophthora idaei]KAG3131935.1 hypothetical protein PI126_g19855 [Phytophthora idaei]